MGDCPICFNAFDLTTYRPKLLHCNKHNVCQNCIPTLGQSGQIHCPFKCGANPFDCVERLNEDPALMQLIEETSVSCVEHSRNAVKFCFTHTLALCSECTHSTLSCDPKEIRKVTRSEIKMHLIQLITGLQHDGHELFSNLPSEYRNVVSDLHGSLLKMLMNTYAYLKKKEKNGVCMGCSSEENSFVDVQNMVTYCANCYYNLSQKSLSSSQSITEYSGHEPDIRQSIIAATKHYLKRINFYQISIEQCEWLHSPPDSFFKFLNIAKQIVNLKSGEQLESQAFPDTLVCPTGHKVYKFRCSIYRLPCSYALHALCEDCANDQSRSAHTLVCPLDGHSFYKTVDSLEKIEWRNLFDPSIRCRISEDHPLASAGKDIPEFTALKTIRQKIPLDRMKAVDRFLTVLPGEKRFDAPQNEDSVFTKPWKVNKEINQVETLTFFAHLNIKLWGVGFATPVTVDKCARVEWVKIYSGNRACGPVTHSTELINKDFIGKDKLVINDVYFSVGISICSHRLMTLKMKVTPLPPISSPFEVYHGNHIGRYVDITGTDGTKFEFVKTVAVDAGEWFSRQQEIIGPILRLIYELE